MDDRDNREKKKKSLSEGEELFESIFKEATLEIKREKTENKQFPRFSPVPPTGRWQKPRSLLGTETSVLKPSAAAPRQPEKAKAPLQESAARVHKNPQPSFGPKAAVLFSLLIILAGIIVYYLLGILDVRLLIDSFNTGHEGEVGHVSVPRQQSAGLPEKTKSSPRQSKEEEKNSSTAERESKSLPPTLGESSSSISVKEGRVAETETPTTIGQARSRMEGTEGKVPPVITSDRPNVPEAAAKQESQPEHAKTELPSKQDALKIALSQLSTPKYPYSVYLGSFKTADAVKNAMSEYQEKGLSPYWAKVDLGEKGLWFRFFTGHYQNKEQAEKFIRERNIQGATPGITKYANLIGIYGSDKEVEDQRSALVTAGFYPYIIGGSDGKSLLYSGAFDRKEYAEKERILLMSKGIKAETVER